MNEVFGKKPVTSREFPAVLFDAGGTLMHLMPPLQKFCLEHLRSQGISLTEEKFDRAWVGFLTHLNRMVEAHPEWYPPDHFWAEALVTELALDDPKKFTHSLVEASTALKWVISNDVIDFCETLLGRGYRLGVVSNATQDLAEIFRVQGILDLFSVVVTAQGASSHRKPQPHFFLEAAEDLEISASQLVHVGESFALDVIGAQRAGMKAVLYDPTHQELKALAETTTESLSKVVSIETLRQNRRLSGVKVVTKIGELLDFFL